MVSRSGTQLALHLGHLMRPLRERLWRYVSGLLGVHSASSCCQQVCSVQVCVVNIFQVFQVSFWEQTYLLSCCLGSSACPAEVQAHQSMFKCDDWINTFYITLMLLHLQNFDVEGFGLNLQQRGPRAGLLVLLWCSSYWQRHASFLNPQLAALVGIVFLSEGTHSPFLWSALAGAHLKSELRASLPFVLLDAEQWWLH